MSSLVNNPSSTSGTLLHERDETSTLLFQLQLPGTFPQFQKKWHCPWKAFAPQLTEHSIARLQGGLTGIHPPLELLWSGITESGHTGKSPVFPEHSPPSARSSGLPRGPSQVLCKKGSAKPWGHTHISASKQTSFTRFSTHLKRQIWFAISNFVWNYLTQRLKLLYI